MDNAAALTANADFLPAFQKLRKFGYDGKGVQHISSLVDQDKAFDAPSLLEKYVDMEMEISVIVVKNQDGQCASFPPVELVFDPKYNLVDYLLSPARITESQSEQARAIAMKVADALNSPGIFAVEMFLTKEGEILVNETAPRAHNSGHQSIEGNYSSQYDQQIRALLNLPLGDTSIVQCSLMLNLIGAEGYSGPAVYQGLEDVLSMPAVYVHLYGKKETKPGRKMGHITLLGDDANSLIEKAKTIKSQLIIKS
jgi:5-(carboxyamino)imidazole ribonucleotide synthase